MSKTKPSPPPTPPPQNNPEIVMAHVQVLRLVDKLLDVAEELREARERLQKLIDQR